MNRRQLAMCSRRRARSGAAARLILVAACLVVAAGFVQIRPEMGVIGVAQAAQVDPRATGSWELMVPNAWGTTRWIWEIRPDGTYSFHAEGTGAPFPHEGTVAFADGQWQLHATMGYQDGGTYQIADPNTLVATGILGTAAWRRSGTAPPPMPSPGPTQMSTWPDAVPEMAAAAAAKARQWRKDAILVEIDAELTPDSYKPYGYTREHTFTIIFYSPSDQSRLLVMPGNPAGEVFEGGHVDLDNPQPIPARFTDLTQAVQAAQAVGMHGKAARAMLQNFAPSGDVAGLMWMIWPIDADRTYNVAASPGAEPVADGGPASREDIVDRLTTRRTVELPIPEGFAFESINQISPTEDQQKAGVAAVVRMRFRGTQERTGYVFFLIYPDRATAEKHADPDIWGIVFNLTVTETWIGDIKAKCGLWRPSDQRSGVRCARVDSTLPVVVIGAYDEPFVEKESTLEEEADVPGNLLGVGIKYLAVAVPSEQVAQ